MVRAVANSPNPHAPTDGHFVLKMPRDEIVAAMEDVFDGLQSAQPTVRNDRPRWPLHDRGVPGMEGLVRQPLDSLPRW